MDKTQEEAEKVNGDDIAATDDEKDDEAVEVQQDWYKDKEILVEVLVHFAWACLMGSCAAVIIEVCSLVVQRELELRNGPQDPLEIDEITWMILGWLLTMVHTLFSIAGVILVIWFITLYVICKNHLSAKERFYGAAIGASFMGTVTVTQMMTCIASISVTTTLALYGNECSE